LVFFVCVGGFVLCVVFGTGIGLVGAVGTSLLASSVRRLLDRPSVNL
jgi:hypothetical protein